MNRQIEYLLPHFSVVVLGTLICIISFWQLAVFYVIVTAAGMFWFWAKICTHCWGYGSKACHSGYGLVSSKFFKKTSEKNFKRAFKRNIWSVALQWFIPLIGGIYSIIKRFDLLLFLLLIVFVFIAFVYIPIISKNKHCNRCPQKDDCPWYKP